MRDLGAGVLVLTGHDEPVSDGVYVVAPDNQTKRREYVQLVTRTFFLENAPVKDVNALLRGIVDAKLHGAKRPGIGGGQHDGGPRSRFLSLRDELDTVMGLCGASRVADLGADLLL